MARPPNTVRSYKKHISIPEDLVAKMELELFSDVEGRIPVGAQAELICNLLRAHFIMLERARKKDSQQPQQTSTEVLNDIEAG